MQADVFTAWSITKKSFLISFQSTNIVSGICFSLDKMLQSSLFSCGDAHPFRLSANHTLIPESGSRCPTPFIMTKIMVYLLGYAQNNYGTCKNNHSSVNPRSQLQARPPIGTIGKSGMDTSISQETCSPDESGSVDKPCLYHYTNRSRLTAITAIPAIKPMMAI
jgi:hypothetical protein